MDDILQTIDTLKPDIVIIDSNSNNVQKRFIICTGNVSQVRECAML
jgi:predicted ATP-dependent serine protease